MNPNEVYLSTLRAVKHGRPILIVGSPGIGKTTVVKKVAKSLDMDLVVSTPAVADPTDAKGLGFPSADGLSAKFLPFGELLQLLNATRPTLWFVDDLGQGTDAVQASFMPYVLARRCGEHVLPDCVVLVAATNGRSHKANVRGILEPVKSRFHKIVQMEASYAIWREEFAIPEGMPVEIISYLDYAEKATAGKSCFNDFVPSADIVNCAIPRTWANAGDLINDFRLDGGDENELFTVGSVLYHDVCGAIGVEQGAKLWQFNSLKMGLPDINVILSKPRDAWVPKDLNALVLVINTVAVKATEKNLANVIEYGRMVAKQGYGEFQAVMMKDVFLRHPELKHTNEYVRFMTSKDGDVFNGMSLAA